MSAEIIQFGNPGIVQRRVAVRELAPAPEPADRQRNVVFQFNGKEYEALFHGDGELQWVRATSYRIQNGKRVRCGVTMTMRRGDPPPELVAAALAARAKPPRRQVLGEVDEATVSAIRYLERIKKLSSYIGQKIKAGRLPPDLAADFGTWASTALDQLPALESEYV